jgi:ribosomal protein S14
MKPTDQSHGQAHTRLVCVRCGTSVFADADERHELTSISHAGRTAALERAGHQVAMDLCRHCLRDALRQCFDGSADGASAKAQRRLDAVAARRALCSLADTEAFVRDSNARLDAWRAAEADGGDRDSGAAA